MDIDNVIKPNGNLMDDKLQYDQAIGAFCDINYSDVFLESEMIANETIVKTPKDENGYQEIFKVYLFKSKKNRGQIIAIPSTQDGERIEFPIKVKETKEIIYGKNVYHLATKIAKSKFPAKDTIKFHEFVDSWFPIKHTSEIDKFIYKILILTTVHTQSFCLVATPPSFGKDGAISAIYNTMMIGRNATGGSAAKLAQFLDDPHTTFNEVVGISKTYVDLLYPFFKGVAAGQKFYEHLTTGSTLTKTRYDISKYGFIVLTNEPNVYVENGKMTWEEQFDYAVFDRIPPFLLKGTVSKDNQYSNLFGINWNQEVLDNKQQYINWISRFYYDMNDMSNQELSYSIDRYDIEYKERRAGEDSVRWLKTFQNIGRMVSRYVESKFSESDREEIFYMIMDEIYQRNRDYVNVVKELNLIR